MPNSPDLYRYRLFGLTLQSAIPLPELAPVDAEAGEADVLIERGDVALSEGASFRGLFGTGDEVVFQVESVARYGIAHGRRITVDAEPGAAERHVRLFLLGSVMGMILHQRRILPLHANAIDLGGRAIAFMGKSGAGKSTLAAVFHDQGFRVLTDDVCAITRGDEGFLANPGVPRMRLWRDAVERSGRAVEAHELAFDDREKFVVGTGGEAGDAVPLAALYLLRSDDGGDFAFRRLRGGEALDALMVNTYRRRFVGLVGDTRSQFETCVALAQALPVIELSRPWNGERLSETVSRVEAHLAELHGAKSSTRS